jgi:hypothetical protein
VLISVYMLPGDGTIGWASHRNLRTCPDKAVSASDAAIAPVFRDTEQLSEGRNTDCEAGMTTIRGSLRRLQAAPVAELVVCSGPVFAPEGPCARAASQSHVFCAITAVRVASIGGPGDNVSAVPT